MNCETCHEQMMDVLYGEELRSRVCFLFFEHLDDCSSCRREYEELLETRSLLSTWTVEESRELGGATPAEMGWLTAFLVPWWNGVLKIAATFLILLGAWTVVDRMGLAGTERLMVSQPELMQMVNDLIVLRQGEERKLIGRGLMEFADEFSMQQQMELLRVSQDLQDLDRRYLQVMEETTENLRVLATR